MYLEHFGLTEAPFNITPDTGYFFNAASHQEALNVLLVALRSGDGFIKVTGEVGTGKTLLCRQLLNNLDEGFVTAYLPNPSLTPTALRMAFAEELGLEFPRNIGQHRLLKLITERLIDISHAGNKVVLLVDEAQAMPDESLEALRLLTNLETEKEKLLLVVLFGQPELNTKLDQKRIRQLKQRIIFNYELQPLSLDEVTRYVRHRLQRAGCPDSELFSKTALRQLHQASRGIPRLVNILAHKALMAAFGQGSGHVDGPHMRRAIQDTEDASPVSRWRLLWPTLGTAAMLTGIGMLSLWSSMA